MSPKSSHPLVKDPKKLLGQADIKKMLLFVWTVMWSTTKIHIYRDRNQHDFIIA